MSYRAPVDDMLFTMRHVAGLDQAMEAGAFAELSPDLVAAILGEAGKFAGEVLAPLNAVGDRHGAVLEGDSVSMPPGWAEAYTAWSQAGWNALPANPDYGGQGLPAILNSACIEMWNAANMAFGLGPLLTCGAIEALDTHATQELKDTYLAKLVSGEWMGTMNLTEPQAGSDLSALRTRAERQADGSYKITGSKIFITYGEHDLTENIIHMVLARLPDAPAGTRGISLFIVPKFLVGEDGRPGARNDLRCHSLEHKLGIHASPTCTMVFGDSGGATGYLIGAENRGLACMFTMMNSARLGVALQGVALAERATQQAIRFAGERKQGKAAASDETMSPIIRHADVRRMLMTMKAYTQAARGISYQLALALDQAHGDADEAQRRSHQERAAILTPIAKAFATDIAVEVASLGVQVHGGMGYIEETGAAQHLRDARITPIYEGTNGIQAVDLITRKLPLSQGAAVEALISDIRKTGMAVMNSRDPELGLTAARLREAGESLDRATGWMQKTLAGNRQDDALAGATPYLRLFGLTQGAACLAKAALASAKAMGAGDDDPAHAGRIALCRFYAENLLPAAAGLEMAVTTGAASVQAADLALAH